MGRMKILHVVPSYLPAVRYGGPIFSVHALCRALVRRGHDVHVFTTNVDGPGVSPVPLDVPVGLDGVTIRYFPVPALRRIFWSPRMGIRLRQDAATFDVVHTHSVFLWPTWFAARAAMRNRVPYVLSPRGMLIAELVRRRSRLAKGAWIRLIESRNVENAASIHVTSELEAEELVRFGFRMPPVRVIPNGVDVLSGDDNAAPAPARIAEMAAGTPYLLFVGRINWKKGLDRLIQALPLVAGIRLVIVGNDEEGYRPTLDALAARLGVTERIVFAGPVYGVDKQLLLREAAALVLPSHSENFGNVVLEAMAAGRPVVTTPEVGAASIVSDCKAGVVVEGDPPSLGAGIRTLLADPESAAAMGRRGRNAVLTRFSWDEVAKGMERLYESVRSGNA